VTEPSAAPGTEEFAFAFEPEMARLGLPFGITPSTTGVRVGPTDLAARFGPWRLRTPLTNVRCVVITGPYRLWKVAGPARLSFSDRGVTFATSTARGVCVGFHEPVAAIDPLGVLRHPGLTVTVAEPERFAAAVEAAAEAARTRDR